MCKVDDKRTALTAIKIFVDKVVTAAGEKELNVSGPVTPTIYLPEKKAEGAPADLPNILDPEKRTH